MRLGSSIFYNLEYARQEYIMCAEKHTMATGILGTLIFIRMAKRAPMHHKLYRELVLSYVYGGVIGYAWSHYYWMQYINVVNESYEFVK